MINTPGAFHVSCFTNYEGDRQFSMLRYADQLLNGLRRRYSPDCTFDRISPPWNGKTPGPVASRWKRFVEFPLLARRHWGDIHHITDHGNSPLIRHLPAERTVITCHDLIPLKLADHLSGFSKRIPMSFKVKVLLMRRAARIMADSESTRRDIVSFLGIAADKIDVVYLGVDHDTFHPLKAGETKEAIRRSLGMTWPLTLLNIGAAAFYKNLDGVIETLGLLRQKYGLDIHLVKTTKALSPAQDSLIERRGLRPYIHDISAKSDHELRNLYVASDVFLFPSLWEGFGWPPLEALACGTPVVASGRGSLPEVLGSAAPQIEPDQYDTYARAVHRLLEDAPYRNGLREAGFAQAARFQWDTTAEQVMNVYRQVWHNAGGALRGKA